VKLLPEKSMITVVAVVDPVDSTFTV